MHLIVLVYNFIIINQTKICATQAADDEKAEKAAVKKRKTAERAEGGAMKRPAAAAAAAAKGNAAAKACEPDKAPKGKGKGRRGGEKAKPKGKAKTKASPKKQAKPSGGSSEDLAGHGAEEAEPKRKAKKPAAKESEAEPKRKAKKPAAKESEPDEAALKRRAKADLGWAKLQEVLPDVLPVGGLKGRSSFTLKDPVKTGSSIGVILVSQSYYVAKAVNPKDWPTDCAHLCVDRKQGVTLPWGLYPDVAFRHAKAVAGWKCPD